MGKTVKIHVGKEGNIVIPKKVTEVLGITEGMTLTLKIENGEIVLEPSIDAVELSLRGEKFAKVNLKEPEGERVEQQRRYSEAKQT